MNERRYALNWTVHHQFATNTYIYQTMARRSTRAPARKDDYDDYEDDGQPILLWSAAAVLFVLTALPYLLGNALIELEVLAAQPFLRLILLVLAIAVAALAILREEIPIAILPALAALLILGETFTTMGTSPGAKAPVDRAGYLHVYTQNIGMESPEEFIGVLADGDFDLVLLQEAYLGHKKVWDVLAQQLGYHIYFQVLRRDAGMGGLVMSKTPMQILPSVRTRSWARQIRYFPRVRIKYEDVPVDIYTVHLESLPLVQGGRVLFGSSQLRLQQAEILAGEIAATDHPVILGGDLNSTPIYRSNRPLRDLLTDAWADAGFGFGYTYHASLPFARIDVVLHKGFRTVSAEVVKVSNSDHRGLHVVLESSR